ncbi:unnamed protein product, partial [marine sediment metagenome]
MGIKDKAHQWDIVVSANISKNGGNSGFRHA